MDILKVIQMITTIEEITTAITQLSPNDLAQFHHWYDKFIEKTLWDNQIEKDIVSGKLEQLVKFASTVRR